MMKIVMVMLSTQNGGLEKHVRELSAQLLMLDYRVAVIAPTVFLETLPDGIEPFAISANLSRYNPIAWLQLLRQLKRAQGDLIHAQANKAAYMVGLLKPWLSIPIVATLHNVKRNLKAFESYDHVISVSGAIAQSFDRSNKKIHVIYNGIAKPTVNKIDLAAQFGLSVNQPTLIAVGRLVPAKGFDILIKAVDGLAVNLLIVGEGPDRDVLVQQINQLQKPTNVKLVGHRNDVTDLMAASDAVVVASRREGFSYVFVEALHCRARMLSTRVPDIDAVLPPELIVETESSNALRGRLQALLSNPAGWTNSMQSAWQFAEKRLTCKAMAKKTAAVYEGIVHESS